MAAAYVFFLYASAYICIYIHLFHWNIDIDFHKSLGKLFDWWRRVDSKPLNSGRSGYLLRCFCLALVRLPRLATPWSFLMGFWALQPDSSTMTSTEHCWFCFVLFFLSLLFYFPGWVTGIAGMLEIPADTLSDFRDIFSFFFFKDIIIGIIYHYLGLKQQFIEN